MFSRMRITKSTGTYSDNIKKLKHALADCDAVGSGAGAGLSTSAGFVYSGERFDKNFSDFREKFRFTDMYSGGFYPYQTPGEFWAYWSRYIWINRYIDEPKATSSDLFREVKD